MHISDDVSDNKARAAQSVHPLDPSLPGSMVLPNIATRLHEPKGKAIRISYPVKLLPGALIPPLHRTLVRLSLPLQYDVLKSVMYGSR